MFDTTTTTAPTTSTVSAPGLPVGIHADQPKATVRVPLHGKHGKGHFMTLDADDWTRAEAEWGGVWTLLPNGRGRSYVTSSRSVVGKLADQPGSGSVARLARLIMDVVRGEVVLFRDGNPLNLCRCNLHVLPRSKAAEWRHQQAKRQAEADRSN